nr:DUF4884 domain-containing protein [Pseudomonas sp. BIGb0427]
MTRLALCLLLLATLAGCREPDKPAATVVAGTYKVDKLFTVDGCTVYRFLDGGGNKYFTNCSGTTAWSEDSGKGCDPQKGYLVVITTLSASSPRTNKTPLPLQRRQCAGMKRGIRCDR